MAPEGQLMVDPVLIVHSTEGATIAGAVAAMRSARSECHEVVLITEHNWTAQLLTPWTQPARSLRHPKGTPETNNRGFTRATAHLGKVYQIEIVGFAHSMADKPDAWYHQLADYVRRRCDALDVPKRFPCPFVPNSSAYGLGAAQRLSWAEWETVSGIVGHQHVPGNSHWDPGGLNKLIPLLVKETPMPIPSTPKPTWSLLDLEDVAAIVRGLFHLYGRREEGVVADLEDWDRDIAEKLAKGTDPRPTLAYIEWQLRLQYEAAQK